MKLLFGIKLAIVCVAATSLWAATEVKAQNFNHSQDTLRLTLDEAVSLALQENFNVQLEELAVETAREQVQEAWGRVYPQLSGQVNYSRNVVTANPFAGAQAGGIFDGLGAIDWLQYNERVRQGEIDDEELTMMEFIERQRQGYQEAGITPPSEVDNPFGVDNEFTGALSLTQTLFNGAAFAAIRGAEQFQSLSREGLERETQRVIDEVRTNFYGALLAAQQVEVLQESVERTAKTVEETSRSVEQGVGSKFDRESAKVELVNLETELIEAENAAEIAVKNLNRIIGIPVEQPMRLVGELEMIELPDVARMSIEEAYQAAIEMRPDIKQAESAIELGEIEKEMQTAQYYPTVNLFADYSYLGRVPDDRTQTISDPMDPFSFRQRELGPFDDSYWNPNLAVGVTLSWSIFDGFQRRAQREQAKIAIREAEIQKQQLDEGIRLEIEDAVRSLRTAERRIQSQERNIEQAELNYEFAQRRLSEGVGTALEERQASQQLDQSRLNYFNALHDYLVALSNFELAIGRSVTAIEDDMPELTSEP